jgi:DNA-binding beta-propeller fold protein YncE
VEASNRYERLGFAVAASLAIGSGLAMGGLAGCGPVRGELDAVASRASRSSTIALSDDGARVAMVNPEDGTLSVFETAERTRIARVATGGGPASVVLSPDGKTAFVANRSDGTVVRIRGIDGGSPAIDATVAVGSEPVGVALSPTGARLFVAEFAESRVAVIDTRSMAVVDAIAIDRPRALLVTNNSDARDDDEQLAITQFYGVPVPGKEAKDDGRIGVVRVVPLADLGAAREITLAPVDSGFGVTTAPNQLAALATANGRLFVTSVSASPEGPPRFDANVFPVVHVVELATGREVRDASGTVNLARLIYDAIPEASPERPRFIPGELADLEFVDGSPIAYAVGRAGDLVQRVVFGERVEIGSTQNAQIDVAGDTEIGRCQNPTGIAIDATRDLAYVNCWVSQRLGVVDLASQALVATVESAPGPESAAEASIQRGRRFYFTGRGRWSAAQQNGAIGGEGWSSCGSCHPDGLSDNITWVFATGPRQTTSQDGSFSHGAGPQQQRIFNWTAIFDEHHDFERNTRDVSGGLGAITTAPTLADCDRLDRESPVALVDDNAGIGGLQKPLKELADDTTRALCGHRDWDDIDNFVKTILPPRARTQADPGAVARGRELFVAGGCAMCHGGAGWTVSRRGFQPSDATNRLLAQTAFVPPGFFPATWMYDDAGQPRAQLSGQPAIPLADATGPAEPGAIGLLQVACVTRNVGTFGVPGDDAATDALELRPLAGGFARAQGRAGYNVPSLYGLALGAPYLHHGQAATLHDLFADPRWRFHTSAGNANFEVQLARPGALDDLVAFLLAIDATTPELAIPVDPGTGQSFDACP